tara:strand:+ start:5034 stop:6254 length:1221 start_codon:yes stop_codon:yes gene_type:complete
MKFGGTSVGSIERIKHVAEIIKAEVDSKNQIVVVLSAMAGETDKLVNLTKELSKEFYPPDYDVVISSGEQVSVGALSGLLNSSGIKSQSLLGWQVPIVTSNDHKSSRIEAISSKGIVSLLEEDSVVIIPGFQGISPEGKITTLGRGGSDTSAVAIAAAIDADFCDIYTDVDGVYTTDPNKVPNAKRLDKISYEEMLEMASLGAKVLQTRSVETAMNNDVVLRVLSSFSQIGDEKKGTLVCSEDSISDKKIVTGVAASTNDAKLTLTGIKDKPGVAAEILGALASKSINVDMIVQNISNDRKTTDLTYTVPKEEFDKAKNLMKDLSNNLSYESLIIDSNITKISLVGVGMRSNAGVASQMFRVLSENNINIDVISTSEIKISVLINKEQTEKALNTLHEHFELGKIN